MKLHGQMYSMETGDCISIIILVYSLQCTVYSVQSVQRSRVTWSVSGDQMTSIIIKAMFCQFRKKA